MLKKVLWLVGAIVLLFSISAVYSLMTTRKHSPVETAVFNSGDLEISVLYCRPYKKGRIIFGGLLPYDTYWRTGANEPTIISFSRDVLFNDQEVRAGDYRLYTIPGRDKWTVALNSELENWGYWEPDYSLDVLRTTVKPMTTEAVQEQFLIEVSEKNNRTQLSLHWDQTKVEIPIKNL